MGMRREIKIGLMGIVALVILFFGIKFLKTSRLFSSADSYYITFTNSKGLTQNAVVYADGYNIGTTGDISYTKPNEVVVRIDVKKGVKVPHGTIAKLDEAILGGCTLNLTMGANPTDCYAVGDTITGTEAAGLMDAAADLMPSASQVIAHVDSLVLALNTLVNNPNMVAILDNTRQVTENLNNSTKQLDKLMNNDLPRIASSLERAGKNVDRLTGSLAEVDFQKTMGNVDKTINDLQQTVNSVNAATAKLNQPDNNIGMLLNDTALYGNLTTTMNNAALLLEDIKKHPSRYINVTVFGRKKKD